MCSLPSSSSISSSHSETYIPFKWGCKCVSSCLAKGLSLLHDRLIASLLFIPLLVSFNTNIIGTGNTSSDGSFKPSFLTDQELKHLILEAADGFLFVVSCSNGRIIYVSDSVTHVLNQNQHEFFSSCLYDNIHPEDQEKVREQLSADETSNSGRILDLKSGTVKKEGHQSNMRLCMGSRRGFICRMKLGNVQLQDPNHLHRMRQRNALGNAASDPNAYAVVHCTGYIKNWPPSGVGGVHDQENDHGSHCCLVAIGRLQVTSSPSSNDLTSNSNQEFVTRHSIDGKFSFVDQRVTGILGYQPQELLGKSCFDFLHQEDQKPMKENFEQVLKLKGQMMTFMYRFQSKEMNYVWFRTSSFAFINPYSNEVEYIVCTNSNASKSGECHEGSQPPSESSLTSSHYTTNSMSGIMSTHKHEGVDYSSQRSSQPTTDMYNMMSGQPRMSADRRSQSTSHSYSGYEHPHAMSSYASSGSNSSHASSQMNKTTSSPPQNTWTPRHLQRVSLFGIPIVLLIILCPLLV